MKVKHILIFFILMISYGCFADICYFIPPSKWQVADPKQLSKYVYVGYVKKDNKLFNPSINLAGEKSEATLENYIQAIKNNHKKNKNTTLRIIGKIPSKMNGENTLLQIDKKIPVGDICILQSITKKNDEIFVLTAAVLKNDLSKYRDEIFKSFESLQITGNLLEEVQNKDDRKNLVKMKNDLKEKKISFKDFEDHINDNYSDLGNYWKILVMKEAYEMLSY